MRILCDTKVNCRIIAFTALGCIGSAIEGERGHVERVQADGVFDLRNLHNTQ